MKAASSSRANTPYMVGNASRAARRRASSPGQHDGGEFRGSVGNHEGEKRFMAASVDQVAGDGAKEAAIEQHDKDRAHAQQQAAGKGAKGNADVVLDVVTEHQHIILALTVGMDVSAGRIRRLVHELQIREHGFVHHGIDHLWLLLHQNPGQCDGQHKAERADQVPLPLPSNRSGKAAGKKLADAICQGRVVAVQLVVGTQHQVVQVLLQFQAVGALTGQRQLMAKLAVIRHKAIQRQAFLARYP